MAELNWEDISWFNIEKLVSGQEKEHALEIDLFREMLSRIPASFETNLDSWASVIVGFESYASKKAILYTSGKVTEFESNTLGARFVKPSSWLNRVTSSNNAYKSSGVASIYVQAFVIIKNGPQVFNKSFYERAFGKPPKSWGAYYPGLLID